MIFKYIIAFILLLIPIVNNANDYVVDVNYRYVDVEINKAFEVLVTAFGPYTGNNIESIDEAISHSLFIQICAFHVYRTS